MIIDRFAVPGCVGTGLFVVTTLGCFLVTGSSAEAQANLNLQTQLNILAPPLQVTPATPEVSREKLSAAASGGKCPTQPSQLESIRYSLSKLPQSEIESVLSAASARQKQDQPEAANLQAVKPNPDNIIGYLADNPNASSVIISELKYRKQFTLAPLPINPACKVKQPTTLKVSFPFNPTYETDVLKSGNGSSPGNSAGFGSNVLVTTGVEGRPFDLIALSAGEASSRYQPYFSSSVDSVSSQLTYQMFLYAEGDLVDGAGRKQSVRNITPDTSNVPNTNMITFDTLAFGFQNQTAFTPTFHAEKADLFTPQFTLARQNIDLDGPNAKPCFSGDKSAFCHYANLSLTVGQTFSDIASQQNFNVAGSATAGWRITTELTLSAQGTVTVKQYEDFVGGRRDILLQAGPTLTYAPGSVKISTSESLTPTFSLPVTYFQNYSTHAAAAWSGLVIQPTLTLAFTYPSN